MKESFDENFMADLEKEEVEVDDGKEEREDYQAECNYAPAEGF